MRKTDQQLLMEMDALVARCSKYSGFNLQWERGPGTIRIWDPKNISKSQMVVAMLVPGHLREVYGRLRHWAITYKEEEVLIQLLEGESYKKRSYEEKRDALDAVIKDIGDAW